VRQQPLHDIGLHNAVLIEEDHHIGTFGERRG
jgi:hypothetical protein